jgi:hypothetical protein
MSKLAPIVIALLAALCIGEGIALWRMDARVTELELGGAGESTTANRRSEAAAPPSTDASEAPAPEAVRELTERVAVLERHRETVLARIPALAEAGDGPVDLAVLPAGGDREALEKRLEEVVAAKVDEKLEKRGEKEENKPSAAELAKLVEMTEEQEDATVRAIDEGKKRTMDVLGLPRGDGGSMLDDLVSAVKDAEEPGVAMQKWFQRLMTEKIPGRSDTYLAEIMRIQKATWDRIGTSLSERQFTKLRRAGVDILEVKTGYEPFEALITGDR